MFFSAQSTLWGVEPGNKATMEPGNEATMEPGNEATMSYEHSKYTKLSHKTVILVADTPFAIANALQP